MAIKDLSSGRSDIYKLDPRIIQVKPDWNCRDASDPENIAKRNELAASIKEHGVRNPLRCFMENEIVYVVSGHTRLAACMQLIAEGIEVKSVPVMVEDRYSNEADRIFSQIIDNGGKPLTGLEQAKVFKRLLALGWSQKDIAVKATMSGGRVSQLLELLTLPIELQKFITEGKASASMVLTAFKKHNGDVALTVAELTGAVAVAEKQGRKRAMPKDTEEGGEGIGGASKAVKPATIKALIKAIIENANEQGNIDDTENMVTITMTDDEYRSILDVCKI